MPSVSLYFPYSYCYVIMGGYVCMKFFFAEIVRQPFDLKFKKSFIAHFHFGKSKNKIQILVKRLCNQHCKSKVGMDPLINTAKKLMIFSVYLAWVF